MDNTKKNKLRLGLSFARFITAYFLPAIQYLEGDQEIIVYGWEVAIDVLVNPSNYLIYDNPIVLAGQFIIMNLATPLIVVYIILSFGRIGSARSRGMLGTIAMLSACVYLPFFFTIIFDYFSPGYYAWLIGIFMIYYYLNNASFKRPKA